MKTRVGYGGSGLLLDLPESLEVTVAHPVASPALQHPDTAVARALDGPIGSPALHDIVKGRQLEKGTRISACIIVSDHTRPVPSKVIVEPLLERLNAAGIHDNDIIVLVATGLHRGSTIEELERMLGPGIVARCKVVNHDARKPADLSFLGTSSRGTPIYLNKEYMNADVKIATGYVDPHFFAGYAGGRKAIVPGIAGEVTIMENHSASNINHPKARFTCLEGNPIHEEALEIAKKTGVDFLVNVCLDEEHRIVNVAAGGLEAVHHALVSFMEHGAVISFDEPFDIVIVNNGGYPLDLDLYQSVKSMAIGELAVKKGGTIIAINELRDGFGSAEFKAIIERESDPASFIQRLLTKDVVVDSQWQVQVLARIAMHARILVVSSMHREQFDHVHMGMTWMPDAGAAVKDAMLHHGENARVLVLPAGPQLIPRVATRQ